jgi:hypothetical protein
MLHIDNLIEDFAKLVDSSSENLNTLSFSENEDNEMVNIDENYYYCDWNLTIII